MTPYRFNLGEENWLFPSSGPEI
ncbi:hypothetical protein CEXT_506681, partial [Caerostris extrusa]